MCCHDITLTVNNTQGHDRSGKLSVHDYGHILWPSKYPAAVFLILIEILLVREELYQARSFVLEVDLAMWWLLPCVFPSWRLSGADQFSWRKTSFPGLL